ncbi:hypothetical protein HPP92_021806, partial [Vanilla planifolia]
SLFLIVCRAKVQECCWFYQELCGSERELLASTSAKFWGIVWCRAFGVAKMSHGSSSFFSGTKATAGAVEFGGTHVVRPKGRHQATIVWLHGLGDTGSSWSQVFETLPLPNIKWICPTAPVRPVSVFGGFPSTAWFDVGDLSEDGPDDVQGMDASAAHALQNYCRLNLLMLNLAWGALAWVQQPRCTPQLAV